MSIRLLIFVRLIKVFRKVLFDLISYSQVFLTFIYKSFQKWYLSLLLKFVLFVCFFSCIKLFSALFLSRFILDIPIRIMFKPLISCRKHYFLRWIWSRSTFLSWLIGLFFLLNFLIWSWSKKCHIIVSELYWEQLVHLLIKELFRRDLWLLCLCYSISDVFLEYYTSPDRCLSFN